ncbi:MAG: omp85 [Chlamydiales bacterium]|jgi:outer membrane protein insertion porin family|nr:omp85 [Chlamydiales bacterium]
MTKALAYLFSVIALLTSPLLMADLPQYEDKQVERIEIEPLNSSAGSAAFDSNAIRTHLRTQVGSLFSQENFDADLKSLSEQFDRVEPTLKVVNNAVHVKLQLATKPTIRNIVWKGNEIIKEKDLQKKLEIATNKPFDRQAFNKAFYKVKDHYIKQGFFEAQLEYKIIPVMQTNQVDIEISIIEGRSGRIKTIDLVGFTADEESELLKLISTKSYFFLTSWITGAGTYREEEVEKDKLRVLDYLRNKGYLDSKVDIIIHETAEKKRIILEIKAEKGTRYSFGDFTISGNSLFTEEQVRNQFTIAKGQFFTSEGLNETQEKIKELYGRKGYIDAIVGYQMKLNPQAPEYSIHFNIMEGKQYHVGLIKIFGNHRTQDRVIRNETLLTPGNVFDSRKLKLTERRLLETEYFKTVNVYPVALEKGEQGDVLYRDVHIEVEEKDTGKLYFGLGVSSQEGVFGTVRLTEENFNYQGLPRVFKDGISAVRGGGENASVFTRISKGGQTYGLSWSKPYVNDTPWTVGFDVTQSRLESHTEKYRTRNFGFNLHATYPINEFLYWRLHYRFASPKMRIIDREKAPKEMLRDEKIKGRVSAVGSSLMYNSTDSFYRPTKGFSSELMAECSHRGLGARQDFIHTNYINTYYQPVSKKGTLIYRLDLDFVNPIGRTKYDTLAVNERLFLGGAGSVRGFEEDSLGPKYIEKGKKTKDAKGGLSSNLLSVAYRYTMYDQLDGFLFFDAGHVSSKKYYVQLAPKRYSKSVGFGFVFEIFPRMPITLGFGFPIKPNKKEDDTKKFFFSLGLNF